MLVRIAGPESSRFVLAICYEINALVFLCIILIIFPEVYVTFSIWERPQSFLHCIIYPMDIDTVCTLRIHSTP